MPAQLSSTLFEQTEPANTTKPPTNSSRRLITNERKSSMNASNRFAIETLARQQQTEIERNLRKRMHHIELDASDSARGGRPNLRVGLLVAATTIVSTAVAFGMSLAMGFGFAIL